MFHRRAQQVNSVVDNSINKQVLEMFLQEPKKVISLEEKFTLAETLREVEIEKQLASEERYTKYYDIQYVLIYFWLFTPVSCTLNLFSLISKC